MTDPNRLNHRRSFVISALMAAALLLLSGGAAMGFAVGGFTLFTVVATLVALAAAVVLAGAWIVLDRDAREGSGQPDLFERLNASRSEDALASPHRGLLNPLKRIRARLAGSPFVVGETVRVKSIDAIRKTLDSRGCVEGLPFLPEMERFAGQTFKVFRCIDKIYDYGGDKTLRRMRKAVSLAGVRCSGSHHGGCQALCSLIWKAEWLEPCTDAAPVASSPVHVPVVVTTSRPMRYVCQYTELVAASRPYGEMSGWSKDVIPLIAGNVGPIAFVVAMLTRLFNRVQAMRGGAAFPGFGPPLSGRTPLVTLDLVPGERIRVLDREQICQTLDSTSRNRGLWFDRDMTKHLRKPYQVKGRVDRIIDDATGRLVAMRYPCILLDGVVSSGEHLRFCPQSDYVFWREAWLERQPESESMEPCGEGVRGVG